MRDRITWGPKLCGSECREGILQVWPRPWPVAEPAFSGAYRYPARKETGTKRDFCAEIGAGNKAGW